jgi:hypothetical protein
MSYVIIFIVLQYFTMIPYIMQSQIRNDSSASSTLNTSVKHTIQTSHHGIISAPARKQKQRSPRTFRHTKVMFSDPLDSTSSDEQSFDEDDMFGSDSDVETISLTSGSKEVSQTSEDMVWTLLVKPVQDI